MPPQRTVLYPSHQRAGARFVDFGGWEMPIQYSGIIDEHQAVRAGAGVFDIAHMSEIWVEGVDALPFLNRVLTNDLAKLLPGEGQYTLMCNERGGVVDDLYAYRLAETRYLLIVNASRTAADIAWLNCHAAAEPLDARLGFRLGPGFSGAIAVQGPGVASFIDTCFDGPHGPAAAGPLPSQLRKNQIASARFGDSTVWVARTGYTGEDGFEIVARITDLPALWDRVLHRGAAAGIKPCGLGARDTLRTEMGYPLYGHELDENTSPLEAGLGHFVALSKADFIGRPALAAQKEMGLSRRCVAFRMVEKSAPPRPGYPIWAAGGVAGPLGQVVSGTLSPSLGVGIGMGYVPPAFASKGTALEIEIRGRRFAAEAVSKPIFRKPV